MQTEEEVHWEQLEYFYHRWTTGDNRQQHRTRSDLKTNIIIFRMVSQMEKKKKGDM